MLLEAASSSWLRSYWSSWWASRSSTMCRRSSSRESPPPCPRQCPGTVELAVPAAPSLAPACRRRALLDPDASSAERGGSALGHLPHGRCDTTSVAARATFGGSRKPTSALPVCICSCSRQHRGRSQGRPQASGALTTRVPSPQCYFQWSPSRLLGPLPRPEPLQWTARGWTQPGHLPTSLLHI